MAAVLPSAFSDLLVVFHKSSVNKYSSVLLCIGLFIGGALSLTNGLNLSEQSMQTNGVAAQVNDNVISLQQYQKVVKAFAADKRRELTQDDKNYALQRLIDEELLVQQGIRLGLLRHDINVRGAIVQAVTAALVAENAVSEVSQQDLQQFYENNLGYFSSTKRLQAVRMVFRGEAAAQRAQQAYQQLNQGVAFNRIKKQLADIDIIELPSGLLTPVKLREYIGPSALAVVSKLPVGGYSEPLAIGSRWQIVGLLAQEKTPPAPLSQLREQVLQEYRRRQDEVAFRRYLDALQAQAKINIYSDV